MPAPRLTRTRVALGVALLLLGAGAWISGSAERSGRPERRPELRFPTHPDDQERERIASRQTLPAVPPSATSPVTDERVPPRDPLLRALPIDEADPFVVLEANALRHSRLGELFVQCVLAEQPQAFDEIAKETGIDPLKDVDRVAFAGDAIIVSGFFNRVRWDAFEAGTKARGARYGDEATLWTVDGEAGAVAAWRDQLLVAGPIDAVRRAIDQVEGRVEAVRDDLSDEMAYGEAYGVIPGASAKKLFPSSEAGLASRLADAARRIELHVNAMDDVAGVLRVTGDSGRDLEDLAKSLGAALSVARLKAAAEDDAGLAALLEHAQVVPGGGGFTVEVALPSAILQQFFGDCGRARPADLPATP